MTVVYRGELWVNSNFVDIEREGLLWVEVCFRGYLLSAGAGMRITHGRGSVGNCLGRILGRGGSPLHDTSVRPVYPRYAQIQTVGYSTMGWKMRSEKLREGSPNPELHALRPRRRLVYSTAGG